MSISVTRAVRVVTGASLLAIAISTAAGAQRSASDVRVTAIRPRLYLLVDSTDNMMVYLGKEASLVAGVQSPTLVARAKMLLAAEKAQPVRWALALESEAAPFYADGGWRASGAMTTAQEYLRTRMFFALHPAPDTATGVPHLAPRPIPPGAELPIVGFSQVLATYFGDGYEEEIHFIRERTGYTDADVVVHFERSGVVYLGNSYTTDGYPMIDTTRGGRINGLIATADFFLTNFLERPEKVAVIVPGRGPTTSREDLRAYHGMLVSVRDSVQKMVAAGKTQAEVIAATPSAPFDERWGHGPVTPAQFVAAVYRTVPRPKK